MSEVLQSWSTRGGKYRIDLEQSGDYYTIRQYTSGRSTGAATGIPTREAADMAVAADLQLSAVIDGINYTNNPGRVLIEKTKRLSLDERVGLLVQYLSDEGVMLSELPNKKQNAAVHERIVDEGYEPVMFHHAVRIILSRRRGVDVHPADG